MTKLEKELLLKFLDDLNEKYGCAGCNDYDLPNTDEGWAIYQEIKEGSSLKNRPPESVPLLVMDFQVLNYLRDKLKKIL